MSGARRPGGFGLVELVFVVAILGILTLLAVPAYEASMRKVRRAEGRILLQQVVAAEERYRLATTRYTADPGGAGLAIARQSQPGGYYRIEWIALIEAGQVARVSVTPQNAQAGDPCGVLVLDTLGRRDADAEGCW